MRSVAKVSLVDAAIQQMRDEIRSGRWPVGEKIPTESELIARLGLSRASLREATRALAYAGLVESRQGDGTYVIAVDEGQVALERRLSVAEVLDVLDVRRGLDLASARLAASRRDDEDLHIMREALDRRARAAQALDRPAFVSHDVAFHIAVATATKNPILQDLYAGIAESIRVSVDRDDCFRSAVASGMGDLHEDLYTAIAERDEGRATTFAIGILDLQQSALADSGP